MSERSVDDYAREARRVLSDPREQGWVFGVCAALARRTGWELWALRVVAAGLLLVFTFWTALAYLVLAMAFPETRPRAQARLVRWARRADDLLELLLRGLRRVVTQGRRPGRESDDAFDAGEAGGRPAA